MTGAIDIFWSVNNGLDQLIRYNTTCNLTTSTTGVTQLTLGWKLDMEKWQAYEVGRGGWPDTQIHQGTRTTTPLLPISRARH